MAVTKIRRELETKWVSYYMAATYPESEVRFKVPLGPIPRAVTDSYGFTVGMRVYRPWRPEVDAAAKWFNKTVIVEAKVFKYMDGLSKLPVYKSLVPKTPELKGWPAKIIMELLIPADIPWVKSAAVDLDVKVVTNFVPGYIKEAWEQRDKYWTKEAVEARDKRKEKMRELGFE